MKQILLTFFLGFFCLCGLNVSAKDFTLTIIRTSENIGSTTGELFINGNFVCHTLELPWQNNASYISSIPAGTYTARIRYDKKDQWRVQLNNVPNRSGVQLHIGNYPSQIQGCVLVGDEVYNKENRIAGSEIAFNRLRSEFYGTTGEPISSPDVDIKVEIKYTVARTKFINEYNVEWEYAKDDIWLYGPERLVNNEYKRDLKFIYIKYRGPNTYYRFPIHGGIWEYASKKDGPWDSAEVYYRREN
ncbi:DUF5675 family protein [Pedobacter gandavensis]|uniref:DUF5675 family protein n=1 Tax=Pedobacter gandavensis TaxID=2679963 RepID=UPI00292DF17E|nr:DUF5675 family protein [Pedobacter gandavensis]